MNKKQFSLTLIIVLTSLYTALGQDSKFALRVGANFSSFAGDNADLFQENRTGIVAGFYYDYIYSDKFSIEVGGLYSTYGVGSTDDSSSVKLTYIDIPIMFKYSVVRNAYIFAGPQMGTLITSKFGGEDGNDGMFNDSFKNRDFRGVIGAEYKFDFGVVIGLRYINSLGKIGSKNTEYINGREVTSQLDLKNKAVQLSVSYRFN